MKVLEGIPALQDSGAQAQEDFSVEWSTGEDAIQNLLHR